MGRGDRNRDLESKPKRLEQGQKAGSSVKGLPEYRNLVKRLNELAISGASLSDQIMEGSRLTAELERVMRKKGASESDIAAIWEKIPAAIAGQHHEFQQRLRDLSAEKQSSDDERVGALKGFGARLSPLSDTDVVGITKTSKYAEGMIAAVNKMQSRWTSELKDTQRNIASQSRTRARQEMQIQTASTRLDEAGNVQVLGFDQRLQYLTEQEGKLRSRLQDPDPLKRDIARGQLSDLYVARNRLQIGGTREAAGEILESTRLSPAETAPGIWQSPSLAAQRAVSQTALLNAQQMQARLRDDPTAAPEQQKTANELLRRMVEQLSKIDSSIKQGQEALKTSVAKNPLTQMFMQRRPGEEDADFAKRISQQGAWNKAIGSGLFSAISTGVNTAAAIREMTFDMPRRTIGLESSVEGARQSQILSSLSYSAENRARFGGNVLFGDRTLGAPGYALANRAAAAEMDRRRSAETLSATGTGLKAVAGIGQMILGGGAIAAAGWTGIGGIVGAGLMASGLASASGGLTSFAQNTRVQESGALDAFGPFSSYAGATRQAQQMQARDALMNAAMERNKVNIASQDAYQAQMDSWAQNIRATGALAINPENLLGGPIKVNEQMVRQSGLKARSQYYLDNTKVQNYVYTGADGRTTPATGKDIFAKGFRPFSMDAFGAPTIDITGDVKTASLIQNQAEAESRRAQTTEEINKRSLRLTNEFFAQHGMGAEEWAAKASMVSSQLGAGATRLSQSARLNITQDLYRMGLAGVGTFEQIAGNQASLANITGRTDAKADVKTVLRDAVKAGFDDSRTGQAFMQNTIQVANALGLRSTDAVAGRIGLGARMLGGTEKDMEMMTRGMAQMPAMFEQNRVLGGLNFASFVAGGGLEMKGPFAQTAFDISKNPERALKVRADIERLSKAKGKYGDTDAGINKLLESQEFKNLDPEVRALLSAQGFGGLERFGNIVQTGMRSLIDLTGIETKRNDLLKGIDPKTITSQQREKLKRELRNIHTGAQAPLMALGNTKEQAAAAATYALTADESQARVIDAIYGSRANFDRQMKQGEDDSKAANIFRRQEVATKAGLAAAGAGMARGALSAEDIRNMAVGGKIQFAGGKDMQPMEIDATRAQQLQSGAQAKGSTEEAFQKWATNTNRLQASLQQQMLTSLESVLSGKTQQVYVMNWEGMVVAQANFKDLPAPGHK